MSSEVMIARTHLVDILVPQTWEKKKTREKDTLDIDYDRKIYPPPLFLNSSFAISSVSPD